VDLHGISCVHRFFSFCIAYHPARLNASPTESFWRGVSGGEARIALRAMVLCNMLYKLNKPCIIWIPLKQTPIQKGEMGMRKEGLIGVALVVFLFAWQPAWAGTILVPVDQPTIQAGINAALNGDQVLVAPGTYTERINFLGKAITVQGENGPEETTIDAGDCYVGEEDCSVAVFSNFETMESAISGFTITNGKGSMCTEGLGGGGVYCYKASPTIENCIITENSADYGGGFLAEYSGSSPTITNCTVNYNTALTRSGGGIYFRYCDSPLVINTIVRGNVAYNSGGGIYSDADFPVYDKCVIAENQTLAGTGIHQGGGGIYMNDFGISTLDRCAIGGNISAGSGGGIFCYSDYSEIVNCMIAENQADHDGGGILFLSAFDPRVNHCTIAENTAGQYGGGFCAQNYDASPIVTNSILWFNHAQFLGGHEIAMIYSEFILVEYSNVQGGPAAVYIDGGGIPYWGAGNINLNPQFIGEQDYHISVNSPCIDAGVGTGVAVDIDGDPRPIGLYPDMGADETAETTPCFISLVMGS